MEQVHETRTSPDLGVSIAYKVMVDAAMFYLKNGNPLTAREHIERLANELKFYPDSHDAYIAAMAIITEAERQMKEEEEKRQMQMMREVLMQTAGTPNAGTQATEPPTADDDSALPPALATPRAMEMWEKAQRAGLVDDNYQPLLTRSLSALLADRMAEKLGIANKWKTFEKLWQRNNMRGDYNNGLKTKKASEFIDKLKRLFP